MDFKTTVPLILNVIVLFAPATPATHPFTAALVLAAVMALCSVHAPATEPNCSVFTTTLAPAEA